MRMIIVLIDNGNGNDDSNGNSTDNGNGISIGSIYGIIFGSVGGVILFVCLACFCCSSKRGIYRQYNYVDPDTMKIE